MSLLKKLTFALPFLLALFWFLFEVKPFFDNIYLFFSWDLGVLYNLLWTSLSLLLACLMFVVFLSVSQDWRLSLPISLLSASLPIILFNFQLTGFIIAFGLLISLLICFLTLDNQLKHYINFQPTLLFTHPVKNLATLLIFVCSIGFFLQVNNEIKTNGFQIPSSLIDNITNYATSQMPAVQGPLVQLPSLTSDQLNYLRQNPGLLKQYGIDPSRLNNSAPSSSNQNQSTSPSSKIASSLIQKQIQQLIQPITSFIAPILGILFFFTLQSIFSLEAVFLSPLIWLIFWILEKTNFIHFETEMREVKKMVV